MMKTTKTTTIALVTAIATLLSTGAAFADTPSSNTVQAPKIAQVQSCVTDGSCKSHLDSLVSSGTLDKTQLDTIKSAIPTALKDGVAKVEFNRGNHYGQIKNVLDGLVKAGTITQAQADSIQSAMKPGKKTDTVNVGIKTVMDGLVKTGTITQAQEDAIQSAIKPAVAAVPAIAAVPAVEATPAVDAKTAMDGLVKAGTITQTQEDAIQSAMTKAEKNGKGNEDVKIGHHGLKNPLDGLVKTGTITQDQADAIKSATTTTPVVTPTATTPVVTPTATTPVVTPTATTPVVTPATTTPAAAPVVKDATPAKSVITKIMDRLVKVGLITQAQEDTIQSALAKTPKDGVKTEKTGQDKSSKMNYAQVDAQD